MGETGGKLGLLAERAAVGDRDALEELLAELWPSVHGYIGRWLAGRREGGETAEDLAQDVLVRLAEAVPACRARTDEQVRAWALTAARNRAFDHLRARRRQPTALGAPDSLEELADASEATVPLSPRLAPLWALFAAVYAGLPPLTQSILWHRLVCGESWDAVAAELQISQRSAQRRFQNLQVRLRRRAVKEGIFAAGA